FKRLQRRVEVTECTIRPLSESRRDRHVWVVFDEHGRVHTLASRPQGFHVTPQAPRARLESAQRDRRIQTLRPPRREQTNTPACTDQPMTHRPDQRADSFERDRPRKETTNEDCRWLVVSARVVARVFERGTGG